jgi:hypothetical protein
MKTLRPALAIACAFLALILLAPSALAAPAKAPPATKAADAEAALAPARRIAAGDALPLPSLPADFWDSLAGPDYEDLWTVYAAAGQEITLTVAMPASEDFDLALWAPGTTDFSYHSSAVAVSWHYGSVQESIRYIVPQGAAGTYYVDVWSMFDPVASYDYHLTANVQQPGADALWPPSTDFTDALTAPGYSDLWKVDLAPGRQLIANLTPPGLENFDLCLWAPGTTDFSDPYQSATYSMHYSGAESFKYIVPSGAGGTYYLGVWADSSSVSDGSYRLWFNVQAPSTTAVRITPPQVPLRCVTSRTYTSSGTLKPLHYVEDTCVRCTFEKFSGGRWRSAGTRSGVNENYNGSTRYKITYSFYGYGSGSMKWRVRAVHLADELHPRKVSAWRYFTVRL